MITCHMEQTMNNLDWTLSNILQAIQTGILIISALVIFYQIKDYKKNAIEMRIMGLKAAIEELNQSYFKAMSVKFEKKTRVEGINWKEILDPVNYVASLINEKYTDRKLVLALKGKALYAVGNYINQFSDLLPEDIKAELDNQYKPAKELLDYVCEQNCGKIRKD